LVQIC